MSNQQLRQQLRQQRDQLTTTQQQKNSEIIANSLFVQTIFQQSQQIGVYYAINGEVLTQNIINKIWQLNKQCYLPCVKPNAKQPMQFAAYTPSTRLITNRYAIPEPNATSENIITNNQLDLVIVPLVGFNSNCQRLGMGGGYYDRTFAYKAEQPNTKPYLLGLAFELQKNEQIVHQKWDVTLDCIITERQIYWRQNLTEK